MTKPDYEAVSKTKFDELKDSFKTADQDVLVNEIRRLFDDAEGELPDRDVPAVYLKKSDTLALADRLEAETSWGWSGSVSKSRSDYVEMLDSLTE